MRGFFIFCLCYAVFQIGVTLVRFDFDPEYLFRAVQTAIGIVAVLWFALERLVLPLALVVLVLGWRTILSRWRAIGYAAAGTVLIQLGFSFTRNMIPKIVPYYADQPLAEIDRWLHLGTDPWRFLYTSAGPLIGVDASFAAYIAVWSTLAIVFPVLLAMVERSAERQQRFMLLFLFCWLGIGTVLATAFASVGPIFYDRLLGGDRFATLVAAQAAAGFGHSAFGATQDFLWNGYVENIPVGGGMSAFPSVHLAVATLIALYLAERSLWLVPVGAGFVGTILVISVTSGYHYAVDGYASILLVAGVWAGLRSAARKSSRRRGTVMQPA